MKRSYFQQAGSITASSNNLNLACLAAVLFDMVFEQLIQKLRSLSKIERTILQPLPLISSFLYTRKGSYTRVGENKRSGQESYILFNRKTSHSLQSILLTACTHYNLRNKWFLA
jgi:hypothetical protein